MTKGFIDIHCHILPGLDEGASTIGESMRMLQIARDDGIAGIVATPHIMNGTYKNTREIVVQAISELQRVAATPPVYVGAEIRICRDLAHRIRTHELPLINDGRYILIELPPYVLPPVPVLEGIVRSLGADNITVIFAHPERNDVLLRHLPIMERLVGCGALFQVTAMSITNHFGSDIRKVVLRMIRKKYVHVVATDAHDGKDRSPLLSDAYRKISKEFGEDEAQRLFIRNPLRIIEGEGVE